MFQATQFVIICYSSHGKLIRPVASAGTNAPSVLSPQGGPGCCLRPDAMDLGPAESMSPTGLQQGPGGRVQGPWQQAVCAQSPVLYEAAVNTPPGWGGS